MSTTLIEVGPNTYTVYGRDLYKFVTGPDYNYNFRKETGTFVRWGKTHAEEHDPEFSPIGPELVDMEITSICNGVNGVPCPWCYKSNGPSGGWMSLETFEAIARNLPAAVTQIAFGVDAACSTNPQCWEIFDHCRKIGIIPNVTVAQITPDVAKKLARVMGAVAVSRYEDKNVCYDSVRLLGSERFTGTYDKSSGVTLKSINIHMLLSEETFERAKETIVDMDKDERLDMFADAIVFLSLKQKGRGTNMTPLSSEHFRELVKLAGDRKVSIGFDSCSCNRYLECVKTDANYGRLKMLSEPCEAGCFSLYINVNGEAFPCSFIEGTEGWEKGIPTHTEGLDFLKSVWNHGRIKEWRKKLIKNCRNCPVYSIGEP